MLVFEKSRQFRSPLQQFPSFLIMFSYCILRVHYIKGESRTWLKKKNAQTPVNAAMNSNPPIFSVTVCDFR